MGGSRAIAILGGGVAGLAAALHLARDGHSVTVFERDPFVVGASEDAPAWERRGIPHFLQPHAFIPRGRLELREHLPDVYDALLAAGAHDVNVARKAPDGSVHEGDDDLQYLAVRRPLIEWGLRQAVAADPHVDVRSGVQVAGLRVENSRVTGVETSGGAVQAEVVVDALGRRSPTDRWLADAGVAGIEPPERSDCGVIYYCRYYRQRPGFELPDGPWLLSPRGDLGYLGFSTFPGDSGTFAGLLATPTDTPEWRPFSHEATFEAALARIPLLRQWVDPDGVDPITPVLPMAGLQNTLRHHGAAIGAGLAPIGDALSHIDPVLAHGLSFALIHARELAEALRAHSDIDDALGAYATAVVPWVSERFQFATDLDAQRLRMWQGEDVDFTRHDGAYALFSFVAAGIVALMDAEVFRPFVRRIGLLDSTAVLDGDRALRQRIEERFQERLRTPRPPLGPSRDEMLELIAETVPG